MKRLFFVLISLFFLAVSCSKQKPKGILSDKKMSDLMTEVYILDSYLNTLPIDSGRKVMPVLYQSLFDRFDLDSAGFTANLDYYYGNPVETEKLNSTVKDILTQYEKKAIRVDSIENARVRDSINRVNQLEQWAAEMKDLILNVHLDTTSYTFEANNSAFFQRIASLQINRHVFTKPVPIDPEAEEAILEEEDGVDVERDSTGVVVPTMVVIPPFRDMVIRDTTLKEYKYQEHIIDVFK